MYWLSSIVVSNRIKGISLPHTQILIELNSLFLQILLVVCAAVIPYVRDRSFRI